MTALLAAAWLALGAPALCAAPSPEDLYRDAVAAYDAGELEAASAKLEPFRAKYAEHRLAWTANLLWARCTTDAAESERRFRLLATIAPPETRKQCELEIAALLLLREKYAEAERAYAAFLEASDDDERAEAARYWRAVCLKELGRNSEAISLAEAEWHAGRQDRWRSLAGLLAASLREAAGDIAEAQAAYRELVSAAWAADFRPRALLGAAKTARDPGERAVFVRTLVKGWPDTPEAAEARALTGAKPSPKPAARLAVQVGAFANAGNAAAERTRWQKKGHKVVVLKRGHEAFGELFFVLLGPYPNRYRADIAAREIKAGGVACSVIEY